MDYSVGSVGITTIGIRANDSPSGLDLALQQFDSKLQFFFEKVNNQLDQISGMLENMLLHLQRINGVGDPLQKLEEESVLEERIDNLLIPDHLSSSENQIQENYDGMDMKLSTNSLSPSYHRLVSFDFLDSGPPRNNPIVFSKINAERGFLIEEYERVFPEVEIRAMLFPLNSVKKAFPPSYLWAGDRCIVHTNREEVNMQRFIFTPIDICYGRICLSISYRSSLLHVRYDEYWPPPMKNLSYGQYFESNVSTPARNLNVLEIMNNYSGCRYMSSDNKVTTIDCKMKLYGGELGLICGKFDIYALLDDIALSNTLRACISSELCHCAYVVRRKNQKILPIVEVAYLAGCDVNGLGGMISLVIGFTGLKFPEYDIVKAFECSMKMFPSFRDLSKDVVQRMLKQGVFECYHINNIEVGLGLNRFQLIAKYLLIGNGLDLKGKRIMEIGLDTAVWFIKYFTEDVNMTELNKPVPFKAETDSQQLALLGIASIIAKELLSVVVISGSNTGGKTYQLRVHNIGNSTGLNLRIQCQILVLVETEGLYRRVYYGVHKNVRASATERLDSSKQPDDEFLAKSSMVSRLRYENFVELLCYCVERIQHVPVYEFVGNEYFHDILHERKCVKGAHLGEFSLPSSSNMEINTDWIQKCDSISNMLPFDFQENNTTKIQISEFLKKRHLVPKSKVVYMIVLSTNTRKMIGKLAKAGMTGVLLKFEDYFSNEVKQVSYTFSGDATITSNKDEYQILDARILDLDPWGQGSQKWGSIVMIMTYGKRVTLNYILQLNYVIKGLAHFI